MPEEQRHKSGTASPEARLVGLPKKITALLEKESDRGVILILGAYLETILALIVRATCTTEKLAQTLLEFRSPAGDFSSKISLCEAFGLISPDEAKALNALRKIRNAAAHFDQHGRGFDVLFDSLQTIQQVKGFIRCINLELKSEKPKQVREIFVIACRLLSTKLFIRAVLANRRPIAKSIKEIASVYREKMKETTIGNAIFEAEQQAIKGNPEILFELLKSTTNHLKETFQAHNQQSPPPDPEA